jgi:hypothetical protein
MVMHFIGLGERSITVGLHEKLVTLDEKYLAKVTLWVGGLVKEAWAWGQAGLGS